MIRSVLRLSPRPGASNSVVELFEREQIIQAALTIDGCQGVELWRGENEILVMATWDDSKTYGAWLNHPARNSHNTELSELLDNQVTADVHGALYELALGELLSSGGSA